MLFQFSVFRSEELNYEKLIMEKLLANEQKQHKMSQENIDLINIKCHDLKKQIELLRAGVGRADMEKEFDNVERAVLLYAIRSKRATRISTSCSPKNSCTAPNTIYA